MNFKESDIDDNKYMLPAEEYDNLNRLLLKDPEMDIDPVLVKLFYETAERIGDTRALLNLAGFYEAKQDYKQAYEIDLKAADLGDPRGRFNIGNMYFHGWYVPRDLEKAYQYFADLYLEGETSAAFYMGLYAEKGYLSPPDFPKAIMYYEEAIEGGDVYSPVNLGRLYCEGLGTDQDYKKSFHYYMAGLLRGDDLAYANAGYCFETGQGVEEDFPKALSCYLAGAGKGEEHCIDALERLGYKVPERGVIFDPFDMLPEEDFLFVYQLRNAWNRLIAGFKICSCEGVYVEAVINDTSDDLSVYSLQSGEDILHHKFFRIDRATGDYIHELIKDLRGIGDAEELSHTCVLSGCNQVLRFRDNDAIREVCGSRMEFCPERPRLYPNAMALINTLQILEKTLVPFGIDEICFSLDGI